MISRSLIERFYRGEHPCGTNAFYAIVRQYADAEATVLNLGAGPPTGQPVRNLRGTVKRVVGVDVDPIVLENQELDEAFVVTEDRYPFPDSTFDVVVSDFVLEHLDHPERVFAEVYRVLRPGGTFVFRTPNRYHYVALISRLTPHWFHEMVANRARALPASTHAPWPTRYRVNSKRAITQLAARLGFRHTDVALWESEPWYLVFHPVPFLFGVFYERVVNSTERLAMFRTHIIGRLEK